MNCLGCDIGTSACSYSLGKNVEISYSRTNILTIIKNYMARSSMSCTQYINSMWPLRQSSFTSSRKANIVQALEVLALRFRNPTLCRVGAYGMSSLQHEKQYSPWSPFLKIRLTPSLFLPQVSSASITRQELRYLLGQIPIMSMVG